MTLEASLENSSVEGDDYAWHDFLTERDFRPEDLWEFDCEATAAQARDDRARDAQGRDVRAGDARARSAQKEAAGVGSGEPEAAPEGDSAEARRPGMRQSEFVWERRVPGVGSVDHAGADADADADADAEAGHAAEAGRHADADADADAHAGRRADAEAGRDAGSDTSTAESGDPGDPTSAPGLNGRVALVGLENLELDELSDVLAGLAGLRSWLDAMEVRTVSRLTDLTRDDVSPRFTTTQRGEDMAQSVAASEVALVLNVPERTASRLVDESVHLTVKHRATLAALESGAISRRHAMLIADEALGMPDDAVAGFERSLLDQAHGLTVAKLARRARRLREAHHPETLPLRRAKSVTERHVELRPDDDGMAWLHAYLPAEQACGIYQRLCASARAMKTGEEARTLTQLRADVFTDLLTHNCFTGDKHSEAGEGNNIPGHRAGSSTAHKDPAWQGITAHVNITVPVLTMLDVLAAGTDPSTCGPASSTNRPASSTNGPAPQGLNQFAELEGYGPIGAETAVRLAAHAPSFTRILTHPVTGSVLDVGRETYRPPKHLQDWVRARDKTCRHPGCNRAADGCEIDHTIPWSRGGTTSHKNLACLCPKHHLYKSEGLYGYEQRSPGTIVVRTLAGTTRTAAPDPPF